MQPFQGPKFRPGLLQDAFRSRNCTTLFQAKCYKLLHINLGVHAKYDGYTIPSIELYVWYSFGLIKMRPSGFALGLEKPCHNMFKIYEQKAKNK